MPRSMLLLPAALLLLTTFQSTTVYALPPVDHPLHLLVSGGTKLSHDSVPLEVDIALLFVAVPEDRSKLYTAGLPASLLLPRLLNGPSRVEHPFTQVVQSGSPMTLACLLPPGGGLHPLEADVSAPHLDTDTLRFLVSEGLSLTFSPPPPTVSLTPHVNPDGTISLSLSRWPTGHEDASASAEAPVMLHTLRSGEIAVYDVTGLTEGVGERVFLFAAPTISDRSRPPMTAPVYANQFGNVSF